MWWRPKLAKFLPQPLDETKATDASSSKTVGPVGKTTALLHNHTIYLKASFVYPISSMKAAGATKNTTVAFIDQR